MAGNGLQVVDGALLASLHKSAMQLGAEVRQLLGSDWRSGMAPEDRIRSTISAATVSTQLMETMSWLLTAQAVAMRERPDPGPAVWRSGAAMAAAPGPLGALAVAVDRLYRRVVELDAEVR